MGKPHGPKWNGHRPRADTETVWNLIVASEVTGQGP